MRTFGHTPLEVYSQPRPVRSETALLSSVPYRISPPHARSALRQVVNLLNLSMVHKGKTR